jgi:F-type H+-transporting ATPase subunit a
MDKLHISLSAEKIFDLGPIAVTNSMFTGWIVTLFISLLLLSIVSTFKKHPTGLQSIYEMVYGFIYSTVHSVLGRELTEKLFPLFLTLFLFIMFGSWAGLLPGANTIGFFEQEHPADILSEKIPVPIFRAVTADINTAIALALIVVILIEYLGFRQHGLGYLKKFFNFSSPVTIFVGLLELISEVMRIVTFSFRLFGNIFAGEVILAVMLALTGAYLGFLVFPFLAFEVFVGVIQALVFVMLTSVFINLAVEHHDH